MAYKIVSNFRMKANVRNMRFRYTKNPLRIAWTEKFYPHSLDFLNIVHAIPWHTYTNEIESQVNIIPQDNNNGPGGFQLESAQRETIEIHSGISKPKRMPYTIFGGAACELLNLSYPKAGNLHLIADPTSDIDILLHAPIFTLEDEDIEYNYPLYLKEEDTYTPLTDHYTRWVLERVIEYLGPIAAKFDTDPTVLYTTKEDTPETSLADIDQQVGKLLVTRLHHGDMIKIQITAKLATEAGERADHLLEFVMAVNENQEAKDTFNSQIFKASNFFIEPPITLIQKQLAAIRGRQEVEPEIIYKLKNHYGRVYYLLNAMPWLVDNGSMPKPAPSQLNDLAKAIQDGLFSNPSACSMPTGCNLKKIIAPIRRFIFDKQLPWKDILPAINALPGGGRTRRKRKHKSKRTRRH